MHVVKRALLLLCFSLLPNCIYAKELLLLTDDGPPHMIKATDGGIDLDIANQVLQSLGYQINVFYTPLSRAQKSVQENLADVTVPTFYQEDSENFYLSDPIVYYRPTVFALTEHGQLSHEFEQFKNKRIMTFQGARGYFGKDFSDTIDKNKYREMHDMSVLPELLYKGRTDLVVLDYYIFYYFAQQRIENFNPNLFQSFPLMDKVPAYAGFHSKRLRDEFNQALAKYLSAGKDKVVIKKYLGNNIPIDLVFY